METGSLTTPRWLAWSTSSSARLWLYGGGMLLPACAFVLHYPLAPHRGTLTDIGKLSSYQRGPFVQYVVGMAVMFALYVLALRESRTAKPQHALKVIFACAALMAAAMIWMYPVNAIDLFLYAARSRLLTTYGANPSAALPRDYPADAWAAFVTPEWASHTSPYGPLWNLLAAPFTALAGDRIVVALLGLKLLMAASLLAGGWVIARAMVAFGRAEDAPAAALFYLWNPLVLWEGVGNGHNDVLLALPVLLALWAWAAADRRRLTADDQRPTTDRPRTKDQRPTTNDDRRKEARSQKTEDGEWPTADRRPTTNDQRPLAAGGQSVICNLQSAIGWLAPAALVIPLLVAAALIKFVTLPLIPLAVIALWCRHRSWHERARLALWSGLFSLAAIAVALFPFYDVRAVWASLADQGGIVHTSPASAVLVLLGQRLPGELLRRWLLLLGAGSVLVVWAYQAGVLSRRPGRLPLACFEVQFTFLLLAVWNLRPWYLIWLMAIAALLPGSWQARRAITWTIGGLASYAFLIWVEAWWHPGYDLTQIVGVLVMVGPVILVTLAQLARWRELHSRADSGITMPAPRAGPPEQNAPEPPGASAR